MMMTCLFTIIGLIGCQDRRGTSSINQDNLNQATSRQLGTLTGHLTVPHDQQCHLFRALNLEDNTEVFSLDVLQSQIRNHRYQFLYELPVGAYELYGVLDCDESEHTSLAVQFEVNEDEVLTTF